MQKQRRQICRSSLFFFPFFFPKYLLPEFTPKVWKMFDPIQVIFFWWQILHLNTRAQLFEGPVVRLALNPELSLTRVSFSFVQKNFLKIPIARIYSQSLENVRPHSSNFFLVANSPFKHQGPVVRRPSCSISA